MHVSIHLIEAYSTHYTVYGYLNQDRFFFIEISKDKWEIQRFRLQKHLLQQKHYDYIYACSIHTIKNRLAYIREIKEQENDYKNTKKTSDNLVDEILHRGKNQGVVDQLFQSVG